MNPNAKRITDLLEASSLNKDDLLEIVDLNGDPNGNPDSRQTSLEDLYQFLLDYDLEAIRDALTRYVRVDDSFPDNNGPTFNSLELAVDYSRGIINTDGGSVTIALYYDANGDPLSTNLTNYNWYSSDPADNSINIISEVDPLGNVNGFFSRLAVGRDIDLNDFDEDFDLNTFTVDVDLSSEEDPPIIIETSNIADGAITQSKLDSGLSVPNADTVDNYEAEELLWMTKFIRGDDIDLNNLPYDIDLNEFRTNINL
jgi:hypothetical protein